MVGSCAGVFLRDGVRFSTVHGVSGKKAGVRTGHAV